MAQSPSPEPRAAGVFIALSVIVGAIVGVVAGQPSAGVVVGAGAGIAVALAQWLIDRRRTDA
ncbi:MAG: hypothetical protein ABW173_09295 [Sphingomonas sp.]